MSDSRKIPDQILTIRMWKEPTATSALAWRGTINHLNSGTSQHFVGIENLVREMRSLFEQAHEFSS